MLLLTWPYCSLLLLLLLLYNSCIMQRMCGVIEIHAKRMNRPRHVRLWHIRRGVNHQLSRNHYSTLIGGRDSHHSGTESRLVNEHRLLRYRLRSHHLLLLLLLWRERMSHLLGKSRHHYLRRRLGLARYHGSRRNLGWNHAIASGLKKINKSSTLNPTNSLQNIDETELHLWIARDRWFRHSTAHSSKSLKRRRRKLRIF